MFLSDPKSEIIAAQQRLHDTRREVAFLRLSDNRDRTEGSGSRIFAALDSAVVRASRGARERHAARAERKRAALLAAGRSNIDV